MSNSKKIAGLVISALIIFAFGSLVFLGYKQQINSSQIITEEPSNDLCNGKNDNSINFECVLNLKLLIKDAEKGKFPYPQLVARNDKGEIKIAFNNFRSIYGLPPNHKYRPVSISDAELKKLNAELK